MLSLCDVKQQMQKVLKIRSIFIYSHTIQGMLQRYDRLQHSACLRAVQSKMQTSRNKPSWQERGFVSSYGMINFVKDMPNKYYLLKANPLNYENKHGKKYKTQQNQTEKRIEDGQGTVFSLSYASITSMQHSCCRCFLFAVPKTDRKPLTSCV